MKLDRRSLIGAFALSMFRWFVPSQAGDGSIITSMFLARAGHPLEVTISCKTNGESAGEFNKNRVDFENSQAIQRINEEYIRQGRILRFSYLEKSDSIDFVYVFKMKADYKKWNALVYGGGLFSRKKLPSRYQVSVSKRYLPKQDALDQISFS